MSLLPQDANTNPVQTNNNGYGRRAKKKVLGYLNKYMTFMTGGKSVSQKMGATELLEGNGYHQYVFDQCMADPNYVEKLGGNGLIYYTFNPAKTVEIDPTQIEAVARPAS